MPRLFGYRVKPPNALLHGSLDALILKTLSHGPRHGYAISRWIEERTGDALLIEEGSLYPALYRLEAKRWVEAEWGVSELGRRAKVYRLTAAAARSSKGKPTPGSSSPARSRRFSCRRGRDRASLPEAPDPEVD